MQRFWQKKSKFGISQAVKDLFLSKGYYYDKTEKKFKKKLIKQDKQNEKDKLK